AESGSLEIPFEGVRRLVFQPAGRRGGQPLFAVFARTEVGRIYLCTHAGDRGTAELEREARALLGEGREQPGTRSGRGVRWHTMAAVTRRSSGRRVIGAMLAASALLHAGIFAAAGAGRRRELPPVARSVGLAERAASVTLPVILDAARRDLV